MTYKTSSSSSHLRLGGFGVAHIIFTNLAAMAHISRILARFPQNWCTKCRAVLWVRRRLQRWSLHYTLYCRYFNLGANFIARVPSPNGHIHDASGRRLWLIRELWAFGGLVHYYIYMRICVASPSYFHSAFARMWGKQVGF